MSETAVTLGTYIPPHVPTPNCPWRTVARGTSRQRTSVVITDACSLGSVSPCLIEDLPAWWSKPNGSRKLQGVSSYTCVLRRRRGLHARQALHRHVRRLGHRHAYRHMLGMCHARLESSLPRRSFESMACPFPCNGHAVGPGRMSETERLEAAPKAPLRTPVRSGRVEAANPA